MLDTRPATESRVCYPMSRVQPISTVSYTQLVVAIGSEAYAMVGRTSERIDVVQPLCNGVISNFDLAQYLISHYMKKISGSKDVYKRQG